MEDVTHRTLEVNGIRIHIAEQGSGPVVVLLHGFPSLWYSWRHQIPFLAEAGYHVVALDMRGYGQSDIPAEVSKYTMFHVAGDVIGIIDALGEKQVFLVGHDWGSIVASHVALFRPDLLRGLVNLSVPFFTRNPKFDLVTGLRASIGDTVYVQQWQTPEEGEGEADFAKHGMKTALARIYCMDTLEVPVSKNGKSILDGLHLPDPLPAWLTDEDLQYKADTFNKTGVTGGLNYYRNIRSTWELMEPWTNQGVKVAALFISGDTDMCLTMTSGDVTSAAYKQVVPNLKDVVLLAGVGHFLMEQAPEEVNKHLLKFFQEN